MPSSEVMHKFKKGKLKSGRSGKKVTNPKQAKAIMLSEKHKEDQHGGKYPHDKKKKGGKNHKVESQLRKMLEK